MNQPRNEDAVAKPCPMPSQRLPAAHPESWENELAAMKARLSDKNINGLRDRFDANTLDLAGQRELFRILRELFQGGGENTRKVWDEMVNALAGADAESEDFIRAAIAVRVPCLRCATTGRFITSVMNGKPTGPGGPCYRCNGKGATSTADHYRNFWYELVGRKIYL